MNRLNRYIFIVNSYSYDTNSLEEVEPHAKGWNHFEWFNQWYRNERKKRKMIEEYNRRLLYCKLILHTDL